MGDTLQSDVETLIESAGLASVLDALHTVAYDKVRVLAGEGAHVGSIYEHPYRQFRAWRAVEEALEPLCITVEGEF